uniref:Histone H3.3-like n=1 Tax=Phallusia mammillata TaxID=59560 RepID=A0A6F9DDL0_9ASCI|nr:histone H3.3-like [Phallusia mammillata]
MDKSKNKKGRQRPSRSDVTDDSSSSSDENVPGPSSRISTRQKQSPKKSGSAKRKPSTPTKRRPKKVTKEIMKLQHSTKLCLRKLPFGRLVREIQLRLNPKITHWQSLALQALQEASEAYIVRFFEDCSIAATYANRVTIMQRDMWLVKRIRRTDDVG